jgi:hypothetical protein
MTEHLDGSYPNLKNFENNKQGIMNRQMLVSVICRHNGNYHRARVVVHYFATVSKALRLIMGDKRAFFYSTCSSGLVIQKQAE